MHRAPDDLERAGESFGGRLAYAIEKVAGLSKSEFARKIGRRPQQLSELLRRQDAPSEEMVALLAEALEVPASWLRYGPTGTPTADAGLVLEPAGAGGADAVLGALSDMDRVSRFLAGIAPPGQEKLRKLDALEGLRRMLIARGELPGWWYEVRNLIEEGEK